MLSGKRRAATSPDAARGRVHAASLQLVVLAFMVGACNPDAVEDGPEFSHRGLRVIPVSANVLSSAEVLGRPVMLRVLDTLMWVSDAAGDPGLHLLDARTGSVLLSFGRRGEGPGEFSNRPFSLELSESGDGSVWAFDRQLQRVTLFRPEPLDAYRPEPVSLTGPPLIYRMVYASSEGFIGQASSEDERFVLYAQNGEKQRSVSGELLGPDSVAAALRRNITNNAIKTCAWPGHGFALVNFLVGRIEFYDTKAQLVRLARVPYSSQPELERNERGQLQWKIPRAWYMDCTATADKLYALFSGRLASAFEETAAKTSGRFIHVFDWQGRLTEIYHASVDLRAIGVDKTGSTLYGASTTESRIYRLSLSSKDSR